MVSTIMVPSLISLEETGIRTESVGWLVNTTVNVAVVPSSSVLLLMAETLILAKSPSTLVTETSSRLIAA